jgi:hypothetical protein
MTVVNRIVLLVCCAIAALCLSQASATGPSECQKAISAGHVRYIEHAASVHYLRFEQQWARRLLVRISTAQKNSERF